MNVIQTRSSSALNARVDFRVRSHNINVKMNLKLSIIKYK